MSNGLLGLQGDYYLDNEKDWEYYEPGVRTDYQEQPAMLEMPDLSGFELPLMDMQSQNYDEPYQFQFPAQQQAGGMLDMKPYSSYDMGLPDLSIDPGKAKDPLARAKFGASLETGFKIISSVVAVLSTINSMSGSKSTSDYYKAQTSIQQQRLAMERQDRMKKLEDEEKDTKKWNTFGRALFGLK